MNHDDPSKKPEAVQDDDAAITPEPTPAPRKIMLGKRVLRHFHVKSGVRTGVDGGVSDNGGTRCHSS